MSSTSSNQFNYFQIELPWPISYVPGICRVLALIYILPPILLFTFDVGSYLLFKIFLKPFGNYPMHVYFKQSPREWFERTTSSSKEPASTTTSNSSSPKLSSKNLISPNQGIRKRSSKVSNKSSSSSTKEDRDQLHVEGVGFEGPMLDFKSPTASDYDDDDDSNENSSMLNISYRYFYYMIFIRTRYFPIDKEDINLKVQFFKKKIINS
ncbi:uncharacterized protein MELLADRAFT_85675 [Melampsora larici-populina 98AG31]|uniref:Uncharacterized protein n=1 Tax=Melampsora larici-populina (strain 98AG31 / pathotype 3-4-7) TaxID=747676 RepID=F4RJD7_MELLP|nr:uncharacterized protein MELLADRAFT_85675 [Melampsora larici-populina 98AG31]EGG07297.1 hypothetical protein MELLADRAFT_85675 [Melampsora larici-populina 98AG31]